MHIFNTNKITLQYKSDNLFKLFLNHIEKNNIDYKKNFKIDEIFNILKNIHTINNNSTFNYSFMSMFGSQNKRNYFLFENTNIQSWFTKTCNDSNRNNVAWKKQSHESVKINNYYFSNDLLDISDSSYGELCSSKILTEGAKKQVFVNSYERNMKAREECIKEHGYKCSVCEKTLSEIYGDIAKNFIHVHHIKPLSVISENYNVDPINDLKPLCPNCHSIIHRFEETLTIDELKKHLIK